MYTHMGARERCIHTFLGAYNPDSFFSFGETADEPSEHVIVTAGCNVAVASKTVLYSKTLRPEEQCAGQGRYEPNGPKPVTNG